MRVERLRKDSKEELLIHLRAWLVLNKPCKARILLLERLGEVPLSRITVIIRITVFVRSDDRSVPLEEEEELLGRVEEKSHKPSKIDLLVDELPDV